MLRYPKGAPPRCLTSLTTTPGASWSSVHGHQRAEIRDRLVHDQAHLCAYCQRRIRPDDTMKVEHWDARSPGGENFRWKNLLGACEGKFPAGGAGKPDCCHCDTARGNTPLFLHPVEGQGPSPREYLRYTGAGMVDAEDSRAVADIEALNLNATHLTRGREAVLDALRDHLVKRGWTLGRLRAELKLHALTPGARAPEHAEFLRYHLQRWIHIKEGGG